jgi:hypothetical protein
MLELLMGQPAPMGQRPVAAPAVEPGVPEQEGEELLALSPKIVSHRLAGARKIAHRLTSRVGRPNSGQLARPMQTRQRNRVAPVRFDPLARSFRDQGRSDNHALVAESLNPAIKPISRRPSFKADMQPLLSFRQSFDRSLDGQRTVLDIAQEPDFSARPPSAIATACFVLTTSKAIKTSLCFPMVRPPCIRLGSACPSNPRFYLQRAGHRLSPANMTSSEGLDHGPAETGHIVCY